MIFAEDLIKTIKKNKINFFTGVPDSILKKLSIHLDKKDKYNHIMSTNEGSSIALATGYHLSTKKIPAVYLQNSGLGNAINPLISVTHQKVYSIPMLLIIGWRGAPKYPDEPQHEAQGKITKKMLSLLGIDHCVLRSKNDLNKISKLVISAKNNNKPVACLIEKGQLLSKNNKKLLKKNKNYFLRSYAIEKILENIKPKTHIISTTGYTSRELHQIRKDKNIKNGKDFYMVGGMGHTSMIGLTSSIFSKNEILCLDGDGAVLMHLGALALNGHFANKNFKHIIFNNSAHESVGGQKTLGDKINFKKLSLGFNYKNYYSANSKKTFNKKLKIFLNSKGPSLFEIKVDLGSIKNLSRPKNLTQVKNNFKK